MRPHPEHGPRGLRRGARAPPQPFPVSVTWRPGAPSEPCSRPRGLRSERNVASSVALFVNCVQSNMDGPGCTLRSHRPGRRVVLRGPRPPPCPPRPASVPAGVPGREPSGAGSCAGPVGRASRAPAALSLSDVGPAGLQSQMWWGLRFWAQRPQGSAARGSDRLLLWGALPARLFTPFVHRHADSHLSRGASLPVGGLVSSLPGSSVPLAPEPRCRLAEGSPTLPPHARP